MMLSRLACAVSALCLHRLAARASTTRVSVSELERLVLGALDTAGHPPAHALLMRDAIMYAELRGNNQGVVKLVARALDADPRAAPMQVLRDSRTGALIDGGHNSGMVVVAEAVELCVAKARASGVAVVGCSGYASPTGALGHWARSIARRGLVGLVLSQCNEYVAPHGSCEPVFGTNPIAIGLPLAQPLVLDMATSASAFYGLVTALEEGRAIPDDVAMDSEGRPTTDPAEAMRGALRAFDRGFKGSHLALMVELLAGALTGAAMTDKLAAQNWGSLVVAIDPTMLGSLEDFRRRAEEMCARVKGARRLPGVEEILLPGERGDREEARCLAEGALLVSSALLDRLRAL